MNKRILLPVFLITLLSLVVFVSAVQKTLDFPGTSLQADYVEQSVNIQEGWNIVRGLPDLSWLIENQDKIKAVYALDPTSKEYIRFYPDSETSKISNSNFIWSNYIKHGAFWVYSGSSFEADYWTLPSREISQTPLFNGWNFIGITPEMIGKSMNEIQGNCNFEKIYHFEQSIQEWSSNLVNDDFMDEKLTEDSVNLGLVIKVSEDCALGDSNSDINSPPQIPGDSSGEGCSDSDGGLDYYVKGTVTGHNEDDPTQQITSATDQCRGDTLYEFVCKDSGEYDDESYECPNGCEDGACIN